MTRPIPSENAPLYIIIKTADGITPVVLSLEWRVWTQGTSFYLATRSTLQELKISLHGPEYRGAGNYWKVGYDAGYVDQHGTAGLMKHPLPDDMSWQRPMQFDGAPMEPLVKHAVRLRWVGDLFQPGVPSGLPPKRIKDRKYSQAWVLPAPSYLQVSHVDFYVSEGQPWWPHGRRAHTANAAMGPLKNRAGQFLTAVHHRNSLLSHFSDVADRPNPLRLPSSRAEWVRGLHYERHERGFLQVDERWFPPAVPNENAG